MRYTNSMITTFANIRQVAARFGLDERFDEKDVETLHQLVSCMQHDFGMTRLKLGALLLAVKHHELWAGKAQSFNEYLESLHIRPSAARQYMVVAEKLMFHLKLSDEQLASAVQASMTTLVSACQIMTPQNADDIVSILETLSDRDAKHILGNYEAHQKPLYEKQPTDPKLKKIEREFFSLPNDLRGEFIRRITAIGRSTPAAPPQAGRN